MPSDFNVLDKSDERKKPRRNDACLEDDATTLPLTGDPIGDLS